MPDKLSISDFGKTIKEKHPQYKDMDDSILGQKILDKYPEYSDMVDDSVKKKVVSPPSSTTPSTSFTEPIPEGGLGAPLLQPSLSGVSEQKKSESESTSKTEVLKPVGGYQYSWNKPQEVKPLEDYRKEYKSKKEAGTATVGDYIKDASFAVAEHIGEFALEGITGITEGVKKAGEGAKMMGVIQPTIEDVYNFNKEYPDNLAARGFVKTLAGVGEAGFSAIMHGTPGGVALLEATKGIEAVVPGSEIVFEYLFAPVTSVTQKITGEELTGTAADVAQVFDFALLLGLPHGGKKLYDKYKKGDKLTQPEVAEVQKNAIEGLKDPEFAKQTAEQAGLKIKDDAVIADQQGFKPISDAIPYVDIEAAASRVSNRKSIDEVISKEDIELQQQYPKEFEAEIQRIQSLKPSEAIGETKVEPKPTVEPVSPAVAASETPTEIGGLKVIEKAENAPDGTEVFRVEGDRFLTRDGKELSVAPSKSTPVAEVKPQEVVAASEIKTPEVKEEAVSTIEKEVVPEVKEEIVAKGEIKAEETPKETAPFKEHLTKDGKYLVEKTDKGVAIFNAETGKEVAHTKQNEKVVDEYVDANLESFKRGEKAEIPEGVMEGEIDKVIAENSNNPHEIAQTWINSRNNIDRGSITFEDAVFEAANNIGIDAFERHVGYGTKDALPKLKKRLSKDGIPLDAVAERVRESLGVEESPMGEKAFIEKIVDFITSKEFENYKPNKETLIESELNRKFQEITGLPLTEKLAEKITDNRGAMEKIADKIDETIKKLGSGELTFGSFIPPQVLQVGLQELSTLLRAGIALKRAVNLAIHKMQKAMGEGKFMEKERDEFIKGVRDRIGEQKKALKEAEGINVPAKPSEIKKSVKEITKPDQEKITMTEKNLLKKQIRDIAKGAKIGLKEGKERGKEKALDIEAFKKEAIEHFDKSEMLDKDQKNALKSKAKSLKTFPQLDRFFDYTDKVIEDAGYAKEFTQAKANQRKFKNAKLSSYPANYREAAKHMGQMPMDYVDIKKYNELAEQISNGIKPLTSDSYKPLDYNDAITKMDELRKGAEETQRKELLEQIGGGDFTLAELKEIMSEDIDQFAGNLSEAKAKTLHDNMIRRGEYAKMGIESAEVVPKTTSEVKDLKALRQIDVSKLSNKELRDFILTTDNIITNGRFDGSSIFSAIANKQEGYSFLKKAKVKIATINELGMEVFSLPLMLKKVFGNDKHAGNVRAASGMEDVIRGNTKTSVEMDKVQKEFNDITKKVKSKNKNILNYDNNIFRGIVGELIQSKSSDPIQMNKELELRKGYVEQTIAALEKAGKTKAAEAHQKAYDKIKDFTTQDQIIQSVKEMNDGNYELIKDWIDRFDKNKNALKENTNRVHNELFDEVENNYLPTKMRKIVGSEEIKSDLKRPFYNLDVARNEKQTPTTIKRTYFKKLPENSIRDYEFDKVMFDRYEKSVFDINVSESVQKFKTFMDSPEAINVFGNAENIKIINQKFNKMMDAYMNMGTHSPGYLNVISDMEKVLRKAGATQALGGIGQTVKQPMVMINTAFNLGKDADLLFKSIPSNLQLLKDNTIGQRGKALAGIERGETLSKSEQAGVSEFLRKTIRGFDKLTEPVRDIVFAALKTLDVASAERSWVAYYLKSLREQGIKDVDLKNEHLLSEDPIRKRAISYAEQKVGATQVVSDFAQQAEIFQQNKGLAKTIFRNVIAPFSTFPATSKGRMILDLDNIRKGRDVSHSAMSLAGTIGEIVAFQAVSTYVVGTLRDLGEEALYWMFDIPDDKTEEEKKKDAEFRLKKWYSNVLSDVVGGGFTQAAQNATIDGANRTYWFIESMLDDKKETMPYAEWKKKNAPFYRYEGENQKYGIYSVPKEAMDRTIEEYNLAFTKEKIRTDEYSFEKESKGGLKTKTSIETEKKTKLSKEEENFMKFNFFNSVLYSAGLNDADLYRTIQQAKRNIIKQKK